VNTKRHVSLSILALVTLVLATLAGCGSKTTPTTQPAPAPAPAPAPKAEAKPPVPITFALDWVVAGRHTPYFVALEKGYYKEAGLEVTIVRGNGSSDSIKQVAAGKADFAFGDTASLLLARTKESIPVKAVGMVYARAPFAIYSLKEANINTPKDLEGKTIAAPAGDAVRTLFPAFAKANGIDATKVKWLTVDGASKAPSLFSKKADAITEFSLAKPILTKQATENKMELNTMLLSDHKFALYSNTLLASENTIKDKADLVRAFVGATIKGLQYTLDNPDDAAAAMVKRVPDLDLAIVKAEVAILKDLALTPETKANGLLYIDPKLMTQTSDIVSVMYDVKDVKAAEAYTNDFSKKK